MAFGTGALQYSKQTNHRTDSMYNTLILCIATLLNRKKETTATTTHLCPFSPFAE